MKAKTSEEHPPFPYPRSIDQIPATIRTVDLWKDFSWKRGRLVYQCPDSCWKSHFAAYSRARNEIEDVPEPFPFNHICFDDR